MIEITQIVFFVILFPLIFFSPISYTFYKKVYGSYNYNIFDIASINIILFFLVLTLFSFTNIATNFIFYFIVLVALFSYILNYKKFALMLGKKLILKLFIFFIFFNFAIYINISNNLTLGWDTFIHWMPKAVFFYNDGIYENLDEYHSLVYPHLGAYIWAFFWKNSILHLEYTGRLFYVFVYSVSIFSISTLILNFSNFSKKNIFKSVIFFILFLYFFSSSDYLMNSSNDHLFGGYQEVLIFSFLVLASKLFYLIKVKNNINTNIVIIFFISSYLLIWIKDEGLIYCIILTFLFLIHINVNKTLKISYLLAMTFLIFSQFFIENFYSIDQNYFNMETFFHEKLIENLFSMELLTRSILILKYFIISCLKSPLWIFILFISSYLFIFNKKLNRINYCFTFLILNFLFLYAVYMQTPHDLGFMLTSSMHRLLLQTSGFYTILIIVFTNDLIKEPVFKNSINS